MKTLVTALTYSILLLLPSCDQADDPTGAKGVIDKLRAGVWTPAEVKRDGVDITGEYTSMRLIIGANTYSTTYGGLAWAPGGTWAFPEGSTTAILRDDAVIINFVFSSDAKTLVMDFVIAERQYAPGRVSGLEGVYHLRFIRS